MQRCVITIPHAILVYDLAITIHIYVLNTLGFVVMSYIAASRDSGDITHMSQNTVYLAYSESYQGSATFFIQWKAI
jgi:hypothetical protein